ncbi:MAG: ATP synthase F1 subunit epsilon [Ruminococcus sp.]|nr:ATP synthase F1 subunit epsilon [Ruminococcus sp.]MBR7008615.1 ATP synthase F1 subunit epsilon [Ruminococcus sp.]
MTPYTIKIITPEKTFFQGETTQIIAKTTTGNVGILKGHIPYVANLVSSPFLIEVDGTLKEAAISGGIIKVSPDNVTVVTNAIEWADEIDVARAERSKKNAEERMKRNESQKEFDRAEKKLKRALNRLIVAGKR